MSCFEVTLSSQRVHRFRTRLLRWYDLHHRKLPWRPAPTPLPQSPPPDADPYHVLVSEAMLQQTQVATVIPYFRRFIERYPTVRDLARADEQHVLRLWQGLGYYRRAHHLHAAAKMIVERFDGRVPADVAQLMGLPGVGRYAAGAIASIAFNVPAPILDGNVARVLARWFAIDEPIDDTATRHRLWALAERLVPGGAGTRHAGAGKRGCRGRGQGHARPGDFNQALMELGALVCTPRAPQCADCPMASICDAHRARCVHELPARRARRAPRAVTHHVAAVERNGRYLFEQRGSDSLWARMWQLPTAESLNGQPLAEWLTTRFGLATETVGETETFTHQTTHRTIQFIVQPMRAVGGRLRPRAGVWRRLDALDDLPLANPQRRIVRRLCR